MSEVGERVAVAIRAEGNANTLSIIGFRPPASENGDKQTDWRAWVDAVYIDPAFDGHVFRRAVCDVPAVREQQVSGVYALPVDQVGAVIGVQVVDVFGSVWTTTVTAPGGPAKGRARARHRL
jgi:hypothetical protein